MSKKNEIIGDLSKNSQVSVGDGIDDRNYVCDLKIAKEEYPNGTSIHVVLEPKDTPGYWKGVWNAIAGNYRNDDFEVEKASVYAMFIPVETDSKKDMVPAIAMGYEPSTLKPLGVPDKNWKKYYSVLEKHFQKGDASDISKSVLYLDELMARTQSKRMKMRKTPSLTG
jgi:hypothetical protein